MNTSRAPRPRARRAAVIRVLAALAILLLAAAAEGCPRSSAEPPARRPPEASAPEAPRSAARQETTRPAASAEGPAARPPALDPVEGIPPGEPEGIPESVPDTMLPDNSKQGLNLGRYLRTGSGGPRCFPRLEWRAMPELRKDPVVGRWVIISTERGRRPSDFNGSGPPSTNPKICP